MTKPSTSAATDTVPKSSAEGIAGPNRICVPKYVSGTTTVGSSGSLLSIVTSASRRPTLGLIRRETNLDSPGATV